MTRSVYEYRYERGDLISKDPPEVGVNVIEQRTGNCVKANLPYEKGKELAKFLNKGGGFDGWTPHFFADRSPASVIL